MEKLPLEKKGKNSPKKTQSEMEETGIKTDKEQHMK